MAAAISSEVCAVKHIEIDRRLDSHEAALWGENGVEKTATRTEKRVDRHEIIINGILWIGGLFTAASITMLTAIFWKVVLNGAAISEIVSSQ